MPLLAIMLCPVRPDHEQCARYHCDVAFFKRKLASALFLKKENTGMLNDDH